MDNNVKRIGYLPRRRVLEIIDKISQTESISRSKVVGLLVEEALDARGIANFGFVDKAELKTLKADTFTNTQKTFNENYIPDDEFVDDSGYTKPENKNPEQSISSSDIELNSLLPFI